MTHLEELLKKPGERRLFNREVVAVAVSCELCRIVAEELKLPAGEGASQIRAALSKKLGIKKKKVKKILDCRTRRMTLKQLADYATALGCQVEVKLIPFKEPPTD